MFLHHERVVAAEASPRRWFVVLHGLFGSGRNWSSVARRVVQAGPDWGALLVDLREHGRSLGYPPPHTLRHAAADVFRLLEHLQLQVPVAMGHSFGGKVAMQLATDHPGLFRRLVVVDSTPDTTNATGDATRVLALLRRMPQRFESRGHAVQTMLREGESQILAQWMAMSLVESDGGWAWGMDLDAAGEMLADFRASDYWGLVERGGVRLDFLRATRAQVMAPQACERIKSAGPHARVHDVEGGHWLHVDNPQAVVEIILEQPRGLGV